MVPHSVDSSPHRILLIEDDLGDAGLVARALRRQTEFPYRLQHLTSLGEFLDASPRPGADVILLDLNLPGYSGLDALSALSGAASGVAVVVLTGLDDNDTAMAAVHAGAQDYLVKQDANPHDICRAIGYAIQRRAATDLVLRLQDDFLAHVSHELRTPLSAAIGAIELLQTGDAGPLQPVQERLVKMAATNLTLLRIMVADLIDSTMVRSGKTTVHTKTINLTQTLIPVIEALTPSLERAELTLAIDIDEDLTALADPDRLVQVITNLISNAIKFTPAKGTLTIAAGTATDPSGQPRTTLTVEDNGLGIAQSALPHLFDRLYQVPNGEIETSRKGLGLGLYLCRELLHAQGGEIQVDSTPGQGTRFTVTLPVAPD